MDCHHWGSSFFHCEPMNQRSTSGTPQSGSLLAAGVSVTIGRAELRADNQPQIAAVLLIERTTC